MDKPLRPTASVSCACGNVAVEAIGTPITSVICYCDDCQEGARQIESLPNAVPLFQPTSRNTHAIRFLWS